MTVRSFGRFIKLYEKFTEWEWYHDANTMRLFIHLLIKANWKPSKYKGHDIDTGQIPTGHKALSRDLGMSERSIRTAFEHLKSTGEVTVKTTNKFSIVTLRNYSKYNAGISDNDRQDDRQRVEQASNKRQATRQSGVTQLTPLLEFQTDQTDHTDQNSILPAAVSTAPGATVEKKKRIPKPKTETPSKSGPTWRAYSAAYELRYKIAPVTNAKSYTLCAKLVDAVGATDAPFVAEWYVHSSNAFYAQSGHALSLLVRDAEKLRTEWATGQAINKQRIMDDERRQSNGDVWRSVMEKHGDEPQPAERIDYAKMFDFKNSGDVRDDNESGNE